MMFSHRQVSSAIAFSPSRTGLAALSVISRLVDQTKESMASEYELRLGC